MDWFSFQIVKVQLKVTEGTKCLTLHRLFTCEVIQSDLPSFHLISISLWQVPVTDPPKLVLSWGQRARLEFSAMDILEFAAEVAAFSFFRPRTSVSPCSPALFFYAFKFALGRLQIYGCPVDTFGKLYTEAQQENRIDGDQEL